MRILHLDPDDMDNPLSGGGPVRTFEIYRRLARRHEVTVLTPTFPGSTPAKEREGVRYQRLGQKWGDHGSSHHLSYLMALPGAVRHTPYDLLVEDTMPPASATWTPLFRHRERPLIASVQWFFAREYTHRLKLPFHWGEEYGIRLYSHFVVLSESMRNTIVSRHPRANCRVIPNGVDPALFLNPPQPGEGILYLGRLEVHAKGLDLLLRSFARLPAHRRPKLTLAGTVQQPESLQQWLDSLGLVDQVILHGRYDASQRLRLLREARVVVMPSRLETFGMTIAEANAAARLVLIWDLAPMTEVAAPGTDLRVPAFDVESYAQALKALLELDNLSLLQRGLAAREYARRYDWERLATQQEDFYLELADPRVSRHTQPGLPRP